MFGEKAVKKAGVNGGISAKRVMEELLKGLIERKGRLNVSRFLAGAKKRLGSGVQVKELARRAEEVRQFYNLLRQESERQVSSEGRKKGSTRKPRARRGRD